MNWQEKILNYCEKYNIPLNYLSDTIDEPKVIPMIRGKAFEFTVYEALKNLLNPEIWLVEKPNLNAQIGFHDIDVKVTHRATNRSLSIECKLASKGDCTVEGNRTRIKVKCMRSRTLGAAMVRRLSPQFGIPEAVLQIHNDQYLESNFDFVVTSIGNAFYQTDAQGKFIFSPNSRQQLFLNNFPGIAIQKEAFSALYIVPSTGLSIRSRNNIVCTRRDCRNRNECGFIPNYPVIEFNTDSLEPINGWVRLSNADVLFRRALELPPTS